MPDITIDCKDCGTPFVFTDDEQKWYTNKGLQQPKRCKDCREKKKREREAQGG